MTRKKDGPYSTPGEVRAEDGEVLLDGPDGVEISLTPEAAAETSHRLLFGAAEARGQQLNAEERKRRGGGSAG